MPSPYQRQLFRALKSDGRISPQVIYYTKTAPDRDWTAVALEEYEEIASGLTLHWPSAHFNPKLLYRLTNASADLYVLSDYSAPTTQLAMRILSLRKARWVFWGEVPGFNSRGRFGTRLRRQLQRPIAKAAAIAGIGSDAVDAYRELFPSKRIFNIPYFCDLAAFRSATAERSKKKNMIDVLFSGQLIERKGVDLLIGAFALIADKYPSMRLQLVGTGPDEDALKETIPPNLRDRVLFRGFQQPDALPQIFAAADVFVLPSRHDGWGVVVNEALGAGLPIIVSDRVGARDLVEDGLNGLVTSAGDMSSLATALETLAESRVVRERFARASAERALRWDIDEGVRRWVGLSTRILNS